MSTAWLENRWFASTVGVHSLGKDAREAMPAVSLNKASLLTLSCGVAMIACATPAAAVEPVDFTSRDPTDPFPQLLRLPRSGREETRGRTAAGRPRIGHRLAGAIKRSLPVIPSKAN